MNKKALSIVLVLALILTLNTSIFASPTDSTSDELKQTQDTKKNLQDKVGSLNNEINGVLKQIDNNKKDMDKLANEMNQSEAQLKSTEDKLSDQQDMVQKRVRAMYMNNKDNSYLQIIFSSKSFSDFLSNVNTVANVMNYDNNVLSNVQKEKENILTQKKNLSYANKKLEALKTSNESILSNLSSDINQEKTLLASATDKEKQLIAKKQAEEAAAKAKELAAQKAAANNTSNTATNKNMVQLTANIMPVQATAGKTISVVATAYCNDGFTSSGSQTIRNVNAYSTIAVDPRVIPLGSRVYVSGYGYAIAADTGGDIIGNRIDVFFPTQAECGTWGRQNVTVTVLN